MIRQIFSQFRDIYDINFTSFKPITSKTFLLKCNNNNCYFAKKSSLYSQEKYQFLYDQGIKNVLYPIKNRRGNFITTDSDNKYYVTNFINDFDIVGEIKAVNMADELANLHANTYFKKQLSKDNSRKKMEDLYEYLQYKFNVIESYVRTIETRPFDEYSIIILKNYHHILDAKKIMAPIHKRLVSEIKGKKTVYYNFIHNNPKLNHLLITSGNRYLTSIEKSKIGISSLDMAKYYVECEDLNIDFKSTITNYFAKYDDDFYLEYFYFLVLLFYIKGIVIIDKDYVSAQNFLHATGSIKKFIETFDLKDKNE